MVSLVQKKKKALKAKIYDIQLEANNKGLTNFRSDMAIAKKMEKATLPTLEKIYESGSNLVKKSLKYTWANIQNDGKTMKIIRQPVVNTKGNIMNKARPIEFIKSESALNSARSYEFEPTQYQSKDYHLFFVKTKPVIKAQVLKYFNKRGTNIVYLKVVARFYLPKNGDEINRTFYTEMQTILNNNINEKINAMIEEVIQKIEDVENVVAGTGWVFKYCKSISVEFSKYRPIGGSSYIDLPEKIKNKKACINIKNKDEECFKWAVLSMLHPAERDAERVSHYIDHVEKYDWSMVKFPATIKDIAKFEKANSININVFILQGVEVQPLQITENKFSKEVDLLLICDLGDNGKNHYVGIKSLSRLLNTQYNANNKDKRYYCKRCLTSKLSEESLKKHMELCIINESQKVVLPDKDKNIIKFTNVEKQEKVPFIIYADFECILEKIEKAEHEDKKSSTFKTEKHVVCGFSYKVVCSIEEHTKEQIVYRGEDAGEKFVKKILKEQDKILALYKEDKGMNLTAEQKIEHANAITCYLCNGTFNNNITTTPKGKEKKEFVKVRDHCHLTGAYRGAAHSKCNLANRYPRFIPVVFHNSKNYDGHIILKNLMKEVKNVSCIPNNEEKYISFSINKLRFIDSFAFMASSLENLVENQMKGATDAQKREKMKYNNEHWGDDFNIMTRKGVYPYEYMDSFEKFKRSKVLKQKHFFSSLYNSNITEEDYEHYKKVCKQMKISNLGEYHDLYLRSDVLLLADVFENFRSFCLNEYNLDPAHYYTLPGFGWDALLKMTEVKLDLITDVDLYLFIEQSKRGGVSMISTKYAKANNPYIKDYDKSKPNNYIIDLDANNLYGWAMSQYLPVDGYKWNKQIWTTEEIMSLGDEDEKGYFFMVDLEYPHELHDLHSDYPLAPENVVIKSVSEYSKFLMEKNKIKHDTVGKLVPNLFGKQKYVLHYRNLRQYLQLGMKLVKVHDVVEFNQKPWMKAYIDFNTNKRKVAKDDFEKDLFKLMNNAVFGKTMENLRGRIDFELINNEKRFLKVSKMPQFKRRVIFNEKLIGVHKKKTLIMLNKPIPVGCAILDLSKTLMYDFHYNYIKNKYGNKARLLGTDTDSLKYVIQTEDLYKDIKADEDLFDLSNYSKDHFCFSAKNNKVLGKMKDETEGKPILEFVGLRAKMYSQNLGTKAKKVAKGVKKNIIEHELTHHLYKGCLFNDTVEYHNMKSIRSYSHELYTVSLNKVSLSSYDNKRYVLEDGINTLAHGHYKIKQCDGFTYVSKGNIFSKNIE